MIKEKRKHIRVRVITEKAVWACPSLNNAVNVNKVYDICPDGMFIESEVFPRVGEIVNLNISLPGDLGVLQIKGKVLRRNWAVTKESSLKLGFAIEFVSLTEGVKQIIDAYVVYIRNKQIIEVSKKIIAEYFNQREV